jgi:dGTPase
MINREFIEKKEKNTLSKYACFSKDFNNEGAHPLRTQFQRDRDRIMHSKAFRRLEYKTQVFLTNINDHLRTRLTHTIEVSQIARTLAQILNVNQDLTEAIAIGHDIGHTPFGHAGERALNDLLENSTYLSSITFKVLEF